MIAPASPNNDLGRAAEIVSRVSHELRTPLTAVIGMLDVVLDPSMPLDEAEGSELLALARTEADQMQHLVGNLLSYTRLQRAAIHPANTPTAVRPIVERALARHVDVRRRTHLSIPDGAGVMADPNLYLQIVTNLVQNVQRYSPIGAVEISVTMCDATTRLSISDDGPGVPIDSASDIFETGFPSSVGLGLGLGLSRELARSMGGDLVLDSPRRGGATFTVTLPVAFVSDRPEVPSRVSMASTPRARLLVDIAAALTQPALDETIAGLEGVYSEILGATRALVLIPSDHDSYVGLGSFGDAGPAGIPGTDPLLMQVLERRRPVQIDSLDEAGHSDWSKALDAESALIVPVEYDNEIAGVLALGWAVADLMPETGDEMAAALAAIAAAAIDRSNLAAEVAFERSVRESVMEALPIAISVFVGDPPHLVYWNKRERELLGVVSEDQRPLALDESQKLFEVSYTDGTPLTLDNTPVTATIRSGRGTGPFFLRVRRLDGTAVVTRTYCAPFFDASGNVAGAVVTSEEVDIDE